MTTNTPAAPSLFDLFGEVIHSYTREQAIADGVLVDLTALAAEAGFSCPVAITRTAWAHAIEWTRSEGWQDETGRAWDVVWMASNAARRAARSTGRRNFDLFRVPNTGRGHQARRITLAMVAGPGDNAEMTVTIMLPEED